MTESAPVLRPASGAPPNVGDQTEGPGVAAPGPSTPAVQEDFESNEIVPRPDKHVSGVHPISSTPCACTSGEVAICRRWGRLGWPIEEVAVQLHVRQPRDLPSCAWEEWERGMQEYMASDD